MSNKTFYASWTSVPGAAGVQPLSENAFPDISPRPVADADVPKHTIKVQNNGSVNVWVGPDVMNGVALDPTTGWLISPGDWFEITLHQAQLYIVADPLQTGAVTYFVTTD